MQEHSLWRRKYYNEYKLICDEMQLYTVNFNMFANFHRIWVSNLVLLADKKKTRSSLQYSWKQMHHKYHRMYVSFFDNLKV